MELRYEKLPVLFLLLELREWNYLQQVTHNLTPISYKSTLHIHDTERETVELTACTKTGWLQFISDHYLSELKGTKCSYELH